jgi:hypothetical protein
VKGSEDWSVAASAQRAGLSISGEFYYLKQTERGEAKGLLSKPETLSENPSTEKKKKKKTYQRRHC